MSEAREEVGLEGAPGIEERSEAAGRPGVMPTNLPFKKQVLICLGPHCGGEHGSEALRKELRRLLFKHHMLKQIQETKCFCFGLCTVGPNIIIYPEGVVYSHLKVEDIEEIFNEHILGGRVVERLMFHGE